MYLTRSSSILWQTLTKALNYPLKNKNEQRFLYEHLELLDRQYCLQVDQHLWQSYSDIASQKHVWPVSSFFQMTPLDQLLFYVQDQLFAMAKTNDFELCQQYLISYLTNIQKHLSHCLMELAKHSQFYPIQALPFDQVELRLQAFVDRERKYLSVRNHELLDHFKDDIRATEQFRMISTSFSHHINPQVGVDRDLNRNWIFS